MSSLSGSLDFSRLQLSLEEAVLLGADVRLDNRDELIRRLFGAGLLQKRDVDDASLILAAYLFWGESCPEHLLGDFSFIIWDERSHKVFCARDPLGIKPLHHARTGSVFHFASEACQILEHPAVPRELDERTIGDYLAGLWDLENRTFFHAIRRLPPGHRLIITADSERVERYWDLDSAQRIVYRSGDEYAQHFQDLLRRAVADRLRSLDGVVGVAMSGGLDSCSVAAFAHGHDRCRAFACSLIFPSLQECNEEEQIRAVADHLGLDVELINAERFWTLNDLPSLETPFLSWDPCIRELLTRARSRGARILLTGHGGDDLLAGSALVYADRIRGGDLRAAFQVARHAAIQGRAWRSILYRYLGRPFFPSRVDRMLRRLTGRETGPEIPDWIDPGFARRSGLLERVRQRTPRTARQAIRETLNRAPWDQAVQWWTRTAAPFNIEVRHPFLDRRLLEFLVAIPPERLFQLGLYKPLLRQAIKGLLPERVRLRPKKTNLAPAFERLLGGYDYVDTLAKGSLAVEKGILDQSQLERACRRIQQKKPAGSELSLWYALTLETWLRQYGSSLSFPAAPQELVATRPAA